MRRSILVVGAGRRCVGRPYAANTSSSSSSSFHSSTVICSSGRSSPPRRDRGVGSDNRYNGRNNVDTNTMRDVVIRDGGVGRQGNRLPYENDVHRRKGDPLPPSYIAKLTTRVMEHVRDFPEAGFNSGDSSNKAELSQWYVTAMELIMLTSKLWGRGHDHRSEDPRQFVEVVSLANDLLDRILTMNKNEIDTILLQQESLAIVNDDDYDDGLTPNQSYHRHHSQKERLSTEILCQTVTLGWSRCDPTIAIDAARNSQTILERLEDICRKRRQWRHDDNSTVTFNVRDVTPTKYLYNHVLSCWSRSLDLDANLQARRVLDRMIESKNGITNTSAFSQPDTFSYNNLLNLYASKGDVSAAETLLQHMEEGMADGVQPDVYSYTITMNAFQKRFTSSTYDNRKMNDLERAEDILSRLVSQYEKSGFRDIKLRPTNVTFGTVISMYAQFDRMLKQDDRYGHRTRKWKSDQKLANNADESKHIGWGAANAERVLDWMVGLCERERHIKDVMTNLSCMGNENDNDVKHGGFNYDTELIRPTAHTFVTVMDAWAKAGKGIEGAEHCQRLLDRLISLYDKFGYIELRPNPKCFGTVIDAWSKADDRYQTAESAELVLNRMEELFLHSKSGHPKDMLSNVAYNSVIDAWSRRMGTDTAERAEIILRRLVKNYKLTDNRFLMPDVITYTGVIKAYVNRPDGGKKALEILNEMNTQYRDGNNKARPDIQALAVAMDACAKNGLTSEADRILDGIDDSMKSEVLFNTIISGYKKEGRGKEAESILRKMISLEKDGYDRCRPDMITYAQVIEAWGNSASKDRVARAKLLLDESIQRYKDGDIGCKPSNVTFNVAAESIASSNDEDSETKVLALYKTMEEIGCEPNLISFNIQIKICANATGSEERKINALRIAVSAFNSLSSVGLKADSITYTGMIHALLNLMDDSPERSKAISGIFQKCCNDGYLNPHILNVLTASIPEEKYLSITGMSPKTDFASLPAEWSRKSSRDTMSN